MTDESALLIFAHPYPDRSRANRRLLAAALEVPKVSSRSLYDLYPGFDIDVGAEQAALSRAAIVIWQHPMYWYSVPGLLKHWFDKVLVRGFAYGAGGNALSGKRCLWVVTTGGDELAFGAHGMHNHPIGQFATVVEQTARFCGMLWEDPIVLYAAHRVAEEVLDGAAASYRERLGELLASVRAA